MLLRVKHGSRKRVWLPVKLYRRKQFQNNSHILIFNCCSTKFEKFLIKKLGKSRGVISHRNFS